MSLRLITSERGSVATPELIVIGTIVLLGLVVGFSSSRDAIVSELSDVGGYVQDVDQSISYQGIRKNSSSVGGSSFADGIDYGDSAEDAAGVADNCVLFNVNPEDEFSVRPPSFSGIRKGGTLSGDSHSFTWDDNGTEGITYWWIYAGSRPGGRDYYNSGSSLRQSTSVSVTGLPTDGSTVHVRLWYYISGRWQWTDCEFKAAGP